MAPEEARCHWIIGEIRLCCRQHAAAELHLRDPTDPARLNGCGLVVVNPPFGFEAAASDILAALHARLSTGEAGGGWALTRIADE